jgi:osmoprotectant transport system substrate-binding protein
VTGFQNAAPIGKASVAQAAGVNFAKTVNAVSAKLTLGAVVAMNEAVSVDKKSPANVAKQFLQANGLV